MPQGYKNTFYTEYRNISWSNIVNQISLEIHIGGYKDSVALFHIHKILLFNFIILLIMEAV